MSEDYKDAAQRHWQDAEILHQCMPARLANSSHLYGVSAECCLKVIACFYDPSKKFKGRNGHLPQLFSELTNIAVSGSNANLLSGITCLQPCFANWGINQRYDNQSDSQFASSIVNQQQLGAKNASLLMNNVLGGLI